MKNLIFLLLPLILLSCSEDGNVTLQKCWTLAERGEDVQLYYLCDDERLGISWFRPTYKFYSNNKCEYLVLHPADAHYMEEGVYEFNLETSKLTVKNTKGDLIANFKVLEINSDQLKVEVLDGTYYAF
ncbi:hypothetical protein [Marivirga sp.]|uniref:hypothetical protein n=1 Tax=Marivirga sp. TaxID=2018662 RepID=UPI0025EA44AA|nr:hypothetical protein [Marivirga sp.]